MFPVLPHIDIDSIDSSELFPALDKRAKMPTTIHFTMDFKDFSIRRLLEYCLATDDETAWNEFFERIRPTAFGVVYKNVYPRVGHAPDLIQDLFQETMLKLVDKNKAALRTFEWFHEDSIYAYVKVVASRVVADHFRRPNNEVALDDMPDMFSGTAFSEQ